MLILEAIVEILRQPTVVVPPTNPDAKRVAAAAALDVLQYAVNVGNTPQDSKEDLQITVEWLGGNTQGNVDSWPVNQWPIIELATWGKVDTPRANKRTLLQLGRHVSVFANGLSGDFMGVEISNISVEVDPFQQDTAPTDGSDRWIAGWTYTYNVQHVGDWPSHRTSVGETIS